MPVTSVLLPIRTASESLPTQIDELSQVLTALEQSFELLLIADGTPPADLSELRGLLSRHAHLRLLHIDRPAGISAAISAGVAAAQGDQVLMFDLAGGYRFDEIPALLQHLVRADLVFGRVRRDGLAKAWHRVARLPRWLLLGLEVRDPDCLFWAARHEALSGLRLTRGMYRYLPTLIGMRGFRTSEVTIHAPRFRPTKTDGRPNPGDLLTAWWLKRRGRDYTVTELSPHDPQDRPRIVRVDEAEPRRRAAQHLPSGQTRAAG